MYVYVLYIDNRRTVRFNAASHALGYDDAEQAHGSTYGACCDVGKSQSQ